MSYLVLARHGESQFNAKSLWTGIWDVPLTDKGRHEATLMAGTITDIVPAVAYTSVLSRAAQTLDIILRANHWRPTIHSSADLNERDYGDLTGMNKWAVEHDYGKDQFNRWRRGWDEPVPQGETLKDVSGRALPYFQKHPLADLRAGKNVLLVAHGNSLRTLIKYLDHLSDQAITELEMPFGHMLVYQIDSAGQVVGKEIRRIKSAAPPA